MAGVLPVIGVLGVVFVVAVAWSCCIVSGDCSREEEDLFNLFD